MFVGLALAFTFPLWITVIYLGSPDNGVIFAAYIGSWLMAGAFLSIGCCLSAATKSQVIAFVLTVTVCLVFIVMGLPQVLGTLSLIAPAMIADVVGQLSITTHFESISRGVLDIRDLLFYLLFISCWLTATAVVIEKKKAE